MSYRVDEIEDAILATLQADETLAGYVKAFIPVPSLDPDDLEKIIRQFPTIGVISPRGSYDYSISNVQDEDGLFSVLCFNRNLRSPVAAMRGGAAGEKGLWHLVDDCRAAFKSGPLATIDALATPLRRQLLFAGSKWAAASLEVQVRWRYI